MRSYILEPVATDENFDERAYLLANPDVADAVAKGFLESGRSHCVAFGRNEGRTLRRATTSSPSLISEAKKRKLDRIQSLLRTDMPSVRNPFYYDFLSDELRL